MGRDFEDIVDVGIPIKFRIEMDAKHTEFANQGDVRKEVHGMEIRIGIRRYNI